MPIATINRRRLLKTATALVAAPAILRVTRASAQNATFKDSISAIHSAGVSQSVTAG